MSALSNTGMLPSTVSYNFCNAQSNDFLISEKKSAYILQFTDYKTDTKWFISARRADLQIYLQIFGGYHP